MLGKRAEMGESFSRKINDFREICKIKKITKPKPENIKPNLGIQ